MIDVQDVFKRVQDLSRKDRSGFMNSEEFTRDLNQTQDILMQFYYKSFEQNQLIVDSLMPFLKEENIFINSGFCDFPSDYRYRIEVGYNIIKNQKNDNCKPLDPDVKPTMMRYLSANEVLLTEGSAIRRPSLEKNLLYHTFVNNKIKVLPKSLVGSIILKYISDPPPAKYATIINPSTDKEDFDSANSVNLVWNEQDFHNIVDIMLLFKGIEVRESALIQWIQQKKIISNAI